MWTNITDIHTLDQIESQSQSKDIIIFKHSTRCPISSMALNRLESDIQQVKEKAHFYFLDLIKYRSISNEIAERYKVEHQSPQVILLRDGVAIYDESHNGISIAALDEQLA